MSGVGRDGIAANELAIIFFQDTAIVQGNAAIGVNFFHRHQFAIGESASVLALSVGLELQAVASGQ